MRRKPEGRAKLDDTAQRRVRGSGDIREELALLLKRQMPWDVAEGRGVSLKAGV